MRRIYTNLWARFISSTNIEMAADSAIRGKKKSVQIENFIKNRVSMLAKLRHILKKHKYKTSEYTERKIFRPKERLIYVLPFFPDRIVQHALINILGPIWMRGFISDSYACITGRGLHSASRRVMQFIRRNKYVLHCDIRKFYPSINHSILIKIIGRKIHDKRIMRIIREIVNSIGGETNVPIGNLTSQWFGNVYLNELDKFVHQELRIGEYIRYCDDFLVFSNDKETLHKALVRIREFLAEKLRLDFSKSVIYPTSRGVDFIGYRHFRGYILLRRRTARRMMRRIARIRETGDTSPHARGIIAAAYGWAKHANTYNLRRKMFRGVPRSCQFRRIMQV